MLIVIFTLVEVGKKPKCPLIDDWRKEGSQLKKKMLARAGLVEEITYSYYPSGGEEQIRDRLQ